MNGYTVGEVATLTGRFLNASGALADPSAVVLTVTAPDGSVTTPSPTHASTGVYTHNLTLTQAGIWVYRWEGSGTVEADELGYLAVDTLGSDSLRTGPCSDWCSLADVRALPAYSNTTTLPDVTVLRMIAVASAILYRRTGRQFPGICEATVRPSRACGFDWRAYPWEWRSGNGWWPGWGTCDRGCGNVSEVQLGYSPLRQIVEVKVDGAVLSPSAYRIDDHRWLVRIDGDTWPGCQDLAAAATEAGTFQVRLLHGTDPGPDGVLAAAVFAGELALGAASQPCRLPRRLQTLTRQGTTQTLLDPSASLEAGRTDLVEVESFVHAVNPAGLSRPASVSSPWPRSRVRRTGV